MSGILTPSVIAREALMVLSNNLVIGNLAYKGDAQAFTGAKVGDSVTIRRPFQPRVDTFTGTTSAQNITEGSVNLTLERHFDTTINLTSREQTLRLEDFSEQVIRPVMVAMAEEIDSYLYSKYTEIPNLTGDGTLNSLADLADVDRVLMEQKVPMAGRVGFLSPLTKSRFLSISDLVREDARGLEGSTALREATMGRAMGIQWYGAQAVRSHTPGVPGGTPVGTGAAGSVNVSVTGGGASGTYRAGDIINFANHATRYSVAADLTLSGGAGTLVLNQPLVQAVSGSAITLQAAHAANIVGHPRGLSVASVPLDRPMGGVASEVISFGGYTVRVVYDYSTSTKANTISFDTLVGARVTDPRMLLRFNG